MSYFVNQLALVSEHFMFQNSTDSLSINFILDTDSLMPRIVHFIRPI